MEQQAPGATPRPEVFIIGAGIAGLTLAILLEQINVPYHIFERASEVRPLGSAMALEGNIFPALEQLGIYEELQQVAKTYVSVDFYNAELKKLGCVNIKENRIASGYHNLIFSRPKFYEILLRRVPAHKITFRKKVLRTEESDGKVTIHCSDSTSYTGDILVGADGTYSGVRQNMYKRMDEKGLLPKSDLEEFSIGYTTIVGVATPPNPEKYPQLSAEHSCFNQILYEDGANASIPWIANCYVVAGADNQISWGFGQQLSESSLRDLQFRNSEWGPEKNDNTLEQYRDFPCPLGGTLGDIFDATPKNLISKIYLEEKLFKTWHHGRTVLIGDCKDTLNYIDRVKNIDFFKNLTLHPAGGQGARNAIQDAIILANCIYSMADFSPASINSAFEDYYKQRFHHAEVAWNVSSGSSKILSGQKWLERFARHLVLNYLPDWLMKMNTRREMAYRPQVAWLPLIENRGEGHVLPQEFKSVDAPAIAVGV
ncbi:hypothetical protein BGX26_002259 [Mortierella sp. AD094]|nr:hypothetical protein BGX26_002259 [Mortierella sp. AD094]